MSSIKNSLLGTERIQVGIIGGAGYTGGELIRLLLYHPSAKIVFVHSKSNAGKHLHEVHKDLIGETEIKFSSGKVLPFGEDLGGAVLFLCVGHGEARKFLEENILDQKIKIIDLSQDFRLDKDASFQIPVTGNQQSVTRNFVYGLPELNKTQILSAQNIANPGCFATAIQLGLLPLAKAGLLDDVYTTGITGSTGAGQSLNATSHFSWRTNNIQAYKTLQHQHIHEITQSINQLQSKSPLSTCGEGPGVKFVPWRGDFARGIYVSSMLECRLPFEEIKNLYKIFYSYHPFTHVSDTMIDLKQVVNTNKCLIHLEKFGNKLIAHSAIDNLLKGASGQALQNMNLMFGLDETAGLKLKGSSF